MPEVEHITNSRHVFPTDDALCEQCGYTLKGLLIEKNCPECGLSFEKSSPARRGGPLFQRSRSVGGWLATAWQFLLFAEFSFRFMRIDGSNRTARLFLGWMLLVVSTIALATNWRPWLPIDSFWVFVPLVFALLLAMTYIEILGVTSFSRRRGWRVPFALAERVCCYASVGWLAGVIVSGVAAWFMSVFLDFNQLLGPFRVGWLCYAAVFVLTLLWFETLVWIGVRQVKYANAWPREPSDTPENAPEK